MNYKLLALVPIVAAGALIKNNKQLKVTNYNLEFKNLPEEFHNFKIAQVSDIHCDKVGISDLFFLEKLCKFSPDINIFERLNISYLHNEVRSIYKTNDKINLIGIEDYNYFKAKDELNHRENFQDILSKLSDKNEFNILLSHRPEKFDFYVKEKYNLVFSGHAHGGQWQIPFVGGVFSPSQGFFPKYIHGVYEKENTKLVVSQGLGNSSFPIRINNQIELVLVTLKKEAI